MPLLFPPNLRSLAKLAPRDQLEGGSRFSLTAIRVEDLGGAYRLDVTDGKRLLIVRGPLLTGPESPDEPLGGAAVTLIPAADWKSAFAKTGRARSVALASDDEQFRLLTGNREIVGKPVEGRYPPTDTALPKRPALWSVQVNPTMLAELLAAMAALEPAGGVSLLYFGPGKPLGIVGNTDGGQYLDGLLMPLT